MTWSIPRRVVISLLLAAAIVGIVWAFSMHDETEPVRLMHEGVKVVSPAPGEQNVQQQSTVFVELASGYTLDALRIEGDAVGGDDLEHIAGLNRWSLRPADGKAVERLPGGRVCATAEFHRTGEDVASETFPWCFFVS